MKDAVLGVTSVRMQRGERLKVGLLSRVGLPRVSLAVCRGADLEGMAEEAEAATQSPRPLEGLCKGPGAGPARGPVAGAEWGVGGQVRQGLWAQGALGVYH